MDQRIEFNTERKKFEVERKEFEEKKKIEEIRKMTLEVEKKKLEEEKKKFEVERSQLEEKRKIEEKQKMLLEIEKKKFEEEKKKSEENRKNEEQMKNQEQKSIFFFLMKIVPIKNKIIINKIKKGSIYEIEYNDDLYILRTAAKTLPEFIFAIKLKFGLKENIKIRLHFKRKENFFVLDDIDDLVEETRIRLTISSQLQSNSSIFFSFSFLFFI